MLILLHYLAVRATQAAPFAWRHVKVILFDVMAHLIAASILAWLHFGAALERLPQP